MIRILEPKGISPALAQRWERLQSPHVGPNCTVEFVRDKETKTTYVLKFPTDARLGSSDEAQFLEEAQFWIRLPLHKRIVPAYRVARTDGYPRLYLILEHASGGSVRYLLRKGKLSPDRAVEIALHVVEGLAFLNHRGANVLHLDIKPENVLLDSEGGSRLTDFGLAVDLERARTLLSVRGTLPYMAPEMFRDPRTINFRTDLYSVGVMLFEMLTGELPFRPEAKTAVAWAHAHCHLTPRRADDVNPSVPSGLADLIHVCLQKHPLSRETAHWHDFWGALLRETRRDWTERVTDRVEQLTESESLDRQLGRILSLYELGQHAEAMDALNTMFVRLGPSSHEHREEVERIRDLSSRADSSIGQDDGIAKELMQIIRVWMARIV